jgi:tRNA threonylcarbamoyladenosine biosynthesis protein TsaB
VPRPLILAFDTSGPWCAAALGEVVRAEPMERGQAERLLPLLSEVVAEAGMDWSAVDGFACGTGPGNFTGVRIAVAAARGLAAASGRPAVGVTRFEAVASTVARRPLVVALDARRGESYVQVFAPDPQTPALVAAGNHAALASLPVAGDADWPGVEHLGDLDPAALARAIAACAAERLDRAGLPAPLYLRAADAAPPSDPPPVILP